MIHPSSGANQESRGRAFVLFARSWQALTCIRSLGQQGVEIIAGDELAITRGSLSKCTLDSFQYPNPNAAPPSKLIEMVNDKGWLAEFAQAHDVDVPPTWLPQSVFSRQPSEE